MPCREEILNGAGRRATPEQQAGVRGCIGQVALPSVRPGDDDGALTANLSFRGKAVEQLRVLLVEAMAGLDGRQETGDDEDHA